MSWRQQTDKPLFPDLLWSRPENKKYAGKLLVIGGQAGEFSHVAAAFAAAEKAGAGSIRVLLPESLKKVASIIPEVEFAPANKSGSFAKAALASFFDLADWADQVLLAGDFGKNSETTTILDGFLLRGSRPTTINKDSIKSIGLSLDQLIKLPVTLIIDFASLQKLGIQLGSQTAITSQMPAQVLAEALHKITLENKANLVCWHDEQIWVAVKGKVVSTKSEEVNAAKLSAYSSVWLMQNPKKPIEALTTACFEMSV